MPSKERPGVPEVPPDVPAEYADAYLQAFADAYRSTSAVSEVVQGVVEPEQGARRRRRGVPRPRQAPEPWQVVAAHPEPLSETDEEASGEAGDVDETEDTETSDAGEQQPGWEYEPPETPGPSWEFEPPEPPGSGWHFEPPQTDRVAGRYEFEPTTFEVVEHDILDEDATSDDVLRRSAEDLEETEDPGAPSIFTMREHDEPAGALHTLWSADRPSWLPPALIAGLIVLAITSVLVVLALT